jgi:single-stranded-DNA-specific exonuclease
MSNKRWIVSPPVATEGLAIFPDLPPLVVQLLFNRGIYTPDEVGAFLSRSFDFDNPFRLEGMNEAVTRLRQALRQREAIAVYGDYDADGVTATALLVPLLRGLGAEVVPYIPNRTEEGYGLNRQALDRLASEGIRLVVTVDCGVRSLGEVAFARELGMDVIITDHHAVGDELPAAVAVIDPKRDDDKYPFKQLAGVGLAYKMAQALLRAERCLPIASLERHQAEEEMLDLVALGTVADLAPLVGENRALVSRGLELMNGTPRPGIAAMLSEAGVKPGQVHAATVGFVLGPRLNAAGRLDSAFASYELLVTSSTPDAARLAQQLGAQNRERQRLTREMVERARSQVLEAGDAKAYVLADEAYQAGIAGLVASRVQDEFYRPTLVIALGEDEGKGSARSIAGFHITRALEECDKLLVRFGGHSAAAGFTIRNDRIGAFRQKMLEIADRSLREEDLIAQLPIDAETPLCQMGRDTARQLDLLEPYGVGNPRPVFLSRDVQVRRCHAVGKDGTSLKFKLSDGVAIWDAIAFRQSVSPDEVPPAIDIVYSLQSRVWNDQERLELVIKDWRPAGQGASNELEVASAELYTHA